MAVSKKEMEMRYWDSVSKMTEAKLFAELHEVKEAVEVYREKAAAYRHSVGHYTAEEKELHTFIRLVNRMTDKILKTLN